MTLTLTHEEAQTLRTLLAYVEAKMPEPGPASVPAFLREPLKAKRVLRLALDRATERLSSTEPVATATRSSDCGVRGDAPPSTSKSTC